MTSQNISRVAGPRACLNKPYLNSWIADTELMKTERVSLAIGFLLTLSFFGFALTYYKYKSAPLLERAPNAFLETVEALDLRFNDLKYKLRSPVESKAPVALIAIDDASLREIGRWPWSRELVAEMTSKLLAHGAKSVAFDVIFSEPEKGLKDADKTFGEVIQTNADKVVLGTFSDSRFNYLPYQDLCVAEAFLATGGDQLAKLNPQFTIDEASTVFDDLNWSPLFKVLFQNVQSLSEQQVLTSLGKADVNSLTEFQKNYLESQKSQALFEYCKSWLTKDDFFLKPEVTASVHPLYLQVISENKELSTLSVEEMLEKLRSAYQHHPIPQYGEWTANVPTLQNPANFTASFVALLDTDGYVRRYPMYYRSGNKLGSSFIPSLALQSFLLSGPYRAEVKMGTTTSGKKKLESFQIFDTSSNPEKKVATLPVDSSGQLMVNYYGRQLALPYVSARELFNEKPVVKVQTRVSANSGPQIQVKETEVSKGDFFKGRSVIVGATAVGLYDLRSTPLEANYPGPELHLTVLANLLDQNFLKPWVSEASILPWLLLLLGISLSVCWAYVDSLASFSILLGVLAALTSLDLWLFLNRKIVIHSFFIYGITFACFFCIQLYRYFTEEKKKRELKSTFSKYVSPAVVDELLKDAENLKLGGRKEHMTVFFSDVRGFTTISEKLPPEELSRVLNLYLTPMTELVFKNNGTLDKYIGDAIMAFFGAPIRHPQHAVDACRCALQNLEKLAVLQKEFEAQGLPRIDIGIGINTGAMSVGNMGSNIVQNYTVMGDSVNLAARLEGINKEYGTRIIISEFTHNEIKESFVTREIDRVRVKGKYEPVRIYELICEGEAMNDTSRMLSHFKDGYRLYHEKMFSAAIEQFQKVLEVSQTDPVSKLYIERCEVYLDSAPPQDWDGVYVMKTK